MAAVQAAPRAVTDPHAAPVGAAAPSAAVVLRRTGAVLAMMLAVLAAGVVGRAGAGASAAFLDGLGQALLLSLLLHNRASRGMVAALGIGALGAWAGAAWLVKADPAACLVAAAARAVPPIVVSITLRRIAPRALGLHDAPAVAGTLATALLMPVGMLLAPPAAAAGPAAWLAAGLGVASFLPVALGAGRTHWGELRAHRAHVVALALAAALLAALVLLLPGQAVFALVVLMLLAFRTGPLEVAVAGAVVGLAAGLELGWLHPGRDPAGLAAQTGLSILCATVLATSLRQVRIAARAGQAARHRIQVLEDTVPALVARFGRNLRHRGANREYLQWHGLAPDAVLGRSILEVFGERAAGAMGSAVQRVLAGQPEQLQVVMPDERVLEIRCVPAFADDGSVDGFELFAHDVTWRGAGERRLRAWLEVSELGCAVLDSAGNVGLSSARLESILGVGAGGLAGHALERWLAPSTHVQFRQLLETACTRPGTHTIGLSSPADGVRSDGVRLPVEISLTALPGEQPPRLLAAVRDLTAVQHAERSIADARAQARQAVDAIGDAVVVCDANLAIVAFNPAAARMTGCPEAEALGRSVDEIVPIVDPASGHARPSSLHEAVARNAAVRSQDDRALMTRDGRQLPIEDSGAPIRDREGRITGGVLLFHDVSHARALANTLSHQAQHDHLTGLPNRVLLQDRLSQAVAQIARGGKGALLYLDLDFFKHINDSLGHPAGDHVLQEVSRRLVDGVREDDTVSRQGGDEFVLLLNRLADPRDAARVAEKLIRSIEAPIPYQGQDLHVSASIGIALFPQDGRDVPTIMKQADTALYYAKEAGRCRFSYFTDVMSERAEQRMRTEHDLRIALGNGDFVLHYQPRVRMPAEEVVGMEALVRWRRPDGAIALPDEFLVVAEDTGLIVQLDEWVLQEACRQARYWQDSGLPPLPVSVNVSLARFDGERLLARVREVLGATGLDARWLEIEFIESQMFAQQDKARETITALKDLGVRVAIDDFGRGHSSLSYLVQYRFDTLKIDSSFVHGLPDAKHAAVSQAIIAMGHALDYAVVAEGVETDEQARILAQQGCLQMQGFLFSRPLPAEQFAGLFSRDAGPLRHSREARVE